MATLKKRSSVSRQESRDEAERAFVSEKTGEFCGECGEPQFTSLGGDTCSNGHGGAEPVGPASAEAIKTTLRATPNSILKGAIEKAQERNPFLEGTTPRPPRDAGEIGPNVFPSKDLGEEVEVTFGKDSYPVARYCTVEVGPFTSRTRVRAGETRLDAMRRAYADLVAFADETRDAKILKFKTSFTRVTE